MTWMALGTAAVSGLLVIKTGASGEVVIHALMSGCSILGVWHNVKHGVMNQGKDWETLRSDGETAFRREMSTPLGFFVLIQIAGISIALTGK
jgi:hypothetical protein